MLSIAIALTAQKFEGKYDKGGQPYILHCLHVMYQLPEDDLELRSIGVMHDLFEDTDVTAAYLYSLGFSTRVVVGIECVTHLPGEEYFSYVKRAALNPDGKRVKRQDLRHNSDIMRMKGLRQKDFARLEKYHTAYEYLKD